MEKTQTHHTLPESSLEQSLLYRLIRIYPHEFSRTLVVWIIRFLYRFAFVVSWTLIVAHVASEFHSEMALPVLFLLHALLVFAGSGLSMVLFRKFDLEHIFLASIIAGVMLLLFSQFFFHSDAYRVGMLLFIESFLLVQMSINIETFTERLFTPLESSRTFPVVESGDTFAMLLAGVFLFFHAESLSIFRVVWVIIGALSLLIPLFLQYHLFIRSMPGLCLFRNQLVGHEKKHLEKKNEESSGVKVRSSLSIVAKKHPYILTLVVVILAQWFFAVVLEYLFTYSVSMQALGHGELVPAAAGAVENVLIHEFGMLQMVLAGAALFSNLFLAGRFISIFGVIGGMLLHPMVSLLSLAAMVMNFGYLAAVVSRINAELTGVVYRNAYQSSYYVFEETESQFTRIFLDGLVRPIGSLLGTCFLMVTFFFVSPSYSITSILVGLFVVLLGFMLATMRLQKQYVHLVISQLKHQNTGTELKLSLLDVITQNGFSLDASYVLTLYQNPQESSLIRVKLLSLFAKKEEHIDLIFHALASEDVEVRFAAVDALQILLDAGFFSRQILSRQEMISALRRRYTDEQSSDLRLMILMLLVQVKEKEVLDFLLELLEIEQGDALGNVLLACEAFGDPSFLPLIERFLDSPDPRVWANAVVVLGKHEMYRSSVRRVLDASLHHDSASSRIGLAFALGSLGDRSYENYLEKRLHESESEIEKLLVSFALLQMGSANSHAFYEQIFSHDLKDPSRIMRLVQALPQHSRHVIEKVIQQKAMKALHTFLQRIDAHALALLPVDDLYYLRSLYFLLNVTEGIVEVDELLREKHSSYRHDISHFGYLPLTLSAYL